MKDGCVLVILHKVGIFPFQMVDSEAFSIFLFE